MLSQAWDTLREKFNTDERCDKPSCVEGVGNQISGSLVYPPDRSQIGRANWRYVHARATNFPLSPDQATQERERNWIHSFVYTYPCSICARDFVSICNRLPPRLDSREAYRQWWVDAHNQVNRDLSKPMYR